MARYSLGFQRAALTAAGPIADLASSATDRARLLEVGVFVSAVSGTTPVLTMGMFRSTALGTRTTPTTVLPEDHADPAGTATVATAFSVAPTNAAAPLRRFVANGVGQGIIWTWAPNQLMIANSLSIVLQAITVAGTSPSFTLDGYFVIDE
jgi:hypothetical protein